MQQSIAVLTLDGNDQLRNDWEYLCPPVLQHVVYTLPGKELVWMAGFTESIKEERKIVMVVQLLYFHLDGGRNRVTVGVVSKYRTHSELCHVVTNAGED